MKIYKSKYKDIESICMENDKLKVEFLPSQGAKMASLVFKKTGRELLYQNKGSKYRTKNYDGDYVSGECSGFDDMFPTIEKCFYESFPWAGAVLPDHGEVWSLNWESKIQKDELLFSVKGIRIPYRLEKKISFKTENEIKIYYRLTNLSDFLIDFIWAGHIMLKPEKGCMMKFPEDMKKAVCTISESGAIGKYGDEFKFPIAQNSEGKHYDISFYDGGKGNDFQKFYFKDKFSNGWGSLSYPTGEVFTVRFSEDSVKYFGAVNGEGGSLDLKCIILEPCTGLFDRPDIAKKYDSDCVLNGSETKEWSLGIGLDYKD